MGTLGEAGASGAPMVPSIVGMTEFSRADRPRRTSLSASAAEASPDQVSATPGAGTGLIGGPSRRQVGKGALGAAAAAAAASMTVPSAAQAAPAWDGDGEYLIGRAVRDITGESADVGFLGYGTTGQVGRGIHMRLHSRAFVIEDPATGAHAALVVADLMCPTDGVRQEVLRRLDRRAPGRWSQASVAIGGTHTHAGPGGAGFDELQNVTTLGFQKDTFEAQVEGIVGSILDADADRAPGRLRLSRSELADAGANRSMTAFRRNPQELQDALPDGLDTSSTTLRFERDGAVDAVVNWFATHSTSLPNTNQLVSADNKGYAQYALERLEHGTDLMGEGRPAFLAGFANSNSGDISPNLALQPGTGPTDDPFENVRQIGARQAGAVSRQLGSEGAPVGTGLDTRITYVDMRGYEIRPEFSGTGRTERTGWAVLGTPFGAGSTEDGPGLSILNEGLWGNPFSATVAAWRYRLDHFDAAVQAPKSTLLPVGAMGWVQQQVPVQLIRVGTVWIAVLPGEVTAAVGVLYRRAIARATGAEEQDVIIQATSNGYTHYVTTPEEYDSQQYEGGATIFGRWSAPAYCQIMDGLARAMVEGREVALGAVPPDESATALRSLQGVNGADLPMTGRRFGDVLQQPTDVSAGQTARAVLVGANPNNDLRHGDTYLVVERQEGQDWVRVRDDQDFDTRFHWEDKQFSRSQVTLEWTPPADAAGTYRFVYRGDRRTGLGAILPISGTSRAFRVL